MSNVTISIAGRQYTIACAEGEEAHIQKLGKSIDNKLAAMPNRAGQSEARLLLYGALLLADEAHESSIRADHADTATAEMLEGLAARLESLAQQLETAGKAP